MSLVVECIQKAIQRAGSLDLAALRERARSKQTNSLASAGAMAERRQFMLTQEDTDPRDATAAFERLIAGNELQDVNYLPIGARAARSVGRVWICQPSGARTGFGTGFLIGPGVLLTNHHVLSSREVAAHSKVEFEFERDVDGRSLEGVRFELDAEALFYTHEGLDFSVVAVTPRAVNAERGLGEFGWLPLIADKGKAIEGEWLTIIQHPGGDRKQVCVRENRLLKRAADVLWYSTDTLGGSSGSPVFNNDWLVVALHHSGVPEMKDGKWQTISGQDFDPRIHSEDDVKWVANEGIRISRIYETLQSGMGGHALVRAVLDAPSAPAAPPAPAPAVPGFVSAPTPAPVFAPAVPPSPAHIMPMNPVPNSSALAGQKFLLCFDAQGTPSIQRCSGTTTEATAAMLEKTTAAASSKPRSKAQPKGVAFTFDKDYSKRGGFDPDFLGKSGDKGRYRVNLPKLTPGLKASAVKLLEPEGTKDYVLKYTNLSVVMHARRRFAIYSAANVDFAGRYASLKSKRVWRYDDRIPREAQVGNEAYKNNQFDVGHLTRQEDMEYGPDFQSALQSAADTCHWTNVCMQHAKFNETKGWWQGLEQHILEYAVEVEKGKGFAAQVFTGPVFEESDPVYAVAPGIQVPMKFWKVCAAVNSKGRLFAVAYLMDQTPLIKKHGVTEAVDETPFEPYKLFQLPISELQDMIQLKFTYGPNEKPLSECDPLKDGPPPELDADQDGVDDRQESTGGGDTTPGGWLDIDRHGPYFG